MSKYYNFNELTEEERLQLTNSLTAALRWHVQVKDKRNDDHEHAAVLINLLEDLINYEPTLV